MYKGSIVEKRAPKNCIITTASYTKALLACRPVAHKR